MAPPHSPERPVQRQPGVNQGQPESGTRRQDVQSGSDKTDMARRTFRADRPSSRLPWKRLSPVPHLAEPSQHRSRNLELPAGRRWSRGHGPRGWAVTLRSRPRSSGCELGWYGDEVRSVSGRSPSSASNAGLSLALRLLSGPGTPQGSRSGALRPARLLARSAGSPRPRAHRPRLRHPPAAEDMSSPDSCRTSGCSPGERFQGGNAVWSRTQRASTRGYRLEHERSDRPCDRGGWLLRVKLPMLFQAATIAATGAGSACRGG